MPCSTVLCSWFMCHYSGTNGDNDDDGGGDGDDDTDEICYCLSFDDRRTFWPWRTSPMFNSEDTIERFFMLADVLCRRRLKCTASTSGRKTNGRTTIEWPCTPVLSTCTQRSASSHRRRFTGARRDCRCTVMMLRQQRQQALINPLSTASLPRAKGSHLHTHLHTPLHTHTPTHTRFTPYSLSLTLVHAIAAWCGK